MKYYWKDLEKPPGTWCGLYLRVESDKKPDFQVQVCKNSRIKVINQNKPVFWATISKDYYDVLVLKSYQKWEYDEMPISPIRSSEIEIRKNLSQENYFKEWSKYFIQELTKSKSSFLYKGSWILTGFIPKNDSEWNYKNFNPMPKGIKISIYNARETLSRDKLDWIDWAWTQKDIDGLINLKEKPQADDPRVKWWRKKIREGNLPPIFALFLSCIQAHIIIDGHARLMASILENVQPKIILIFPVIEKVKEIDNHIKEKILNSLEISEANIRDMSQYTNHLLIEVFDESPTLEIKTKGYVVKSLETDWEKEVIKELKAFNLIEQGKYMLERE